MNDCIERKKAIELIQPHVKPQTVYGEGYLQAIEHATAILALMPAADVQPVKRGKWNTHDVVKVLCSGETLDGFCQCTACGDVFPLHYSEYNYCPNYGAKMDGDTECQ